MISLATQWGSPFSHLGAVSSLAAVWDKARPYFTTGLTQNAIGVALCCAWALLVVLLAAWVQRRWATPLWATRSGLRIAHAGWLLIAFEWIAHGNIAWLASWVVAVFFLLLNYWSRQNRYTKVLIQDDKEESPLGNMWVVLAVVWLWWKPGFQFVAMASLLTICLGEAAAVLVGRLYGKHRFRFRGARGLTFEALAAMAGVTLVTVFLTIYNCARIPTWHVPRFWFGAWTLFGALLVTGIATVTYLYTPRPWHRWSVPLAAGITLYYYAVTGFHM